MDFGSWTLEEMQELSEIYQGLAHPARIAILVAIDNDEPMKRVADFLSIQPPSLHEHINTLVELNMIYRPRDTRSYYLTPLGEHLLNRLRRDQQSLVPAVEKIKKTKIKAKEKKLPEKQELEEFNIPIDEKGLQREITQEVWNEMEEEIESLLNPD